MYKCIRCKIVKKFHEVYIRHLYYNFLGTKFYMQNKSKYENE